MNIKKLIPSKKALLITGIVFVIFILLYGGSYWYLRVKTIKLEDKIKKEGTKKLVYIPSGYYIGIVYGIGLSNGVDPPRGVLVYPCWIDSENKVHFVKWLRYFYYPLWRLEIAVWRMTM
jgi:hypothetical protein